MRGCAYHCRGYPFGGCDSHFTSLKAFDRHRQGPHDGERVCADPADVGLVAGEGRCKLQRPVVDGSVTLWSLPLTEADRKRLAAVRPRRGGSPPSLAVPPARETGAE